MAERIAIMIITAKYNPYLFNAKMTLLSKNNSVVVKSIEDIRPIGIQSIYSKIIEKTLKALVDKHTPSFLEC